MRSLAICRLRKSFRCDASKPDVARLDPDLFPARLILRAHSDFDVEHLTVSRLCNVGSQTKVDGTDEKGACPRAKRDAWPADCASNVATPTDPGAPVWIPED